MRVRKIQRAPVKAPAESPHLNTTKVFLSPLGESIVHEITQVFPMPVLLLGGTGWGKSVMAREAARRLSLKYTSVNAHPGMDIGLLVGMWRPVPTQSGISITWQDGMLTQAVMSGMMFLFEEITRAPQEMISRIFGLLDGSFRYWTIPEAGILDVPIDPRFMLLATANPTGAGYNTQRLDKALIRRFVATFEINEPVADERAILRDILGDDPIVMRLIKFVETARGDKEHTNVNTGDLVQVAQLIQKGFTPSRAVQLALSPKYSGSSDGLQLVVRAHFS